MSFSRSVVLMTAGLFLLFAGTGQAVVGPPTIAIVSGDGQMIPASNIASAAMIVVVRDAAGNPINGATVTWTLQGTGSVVNVPPPNVTCNANLTEANGQTCHTFIGGALILPTSFAQSVVTASYGGASVSFTQTTVTQSNGALEVQAFYSSPTQDQLPLIGPAGTQGSIPVTLRVQAIFGFQAGQGVPHVSVTIQPADPTSPSTIACAGGTILTDANGTAVCNPVFGGKTGPVQNFTTSVGGIPGQLFRFQVTTGPPAVIKILSGNNQSGIPGQLLNAPLSAEIDDAGGNPLQGIAAVFESLQAGAVVFSDVRSPSDAAGRVSARVTLGNVPGVIQVRVRTNSGSPSALFTINVNLVVAGLQKVSGDGQNPAVINTQFHEPLVVQVIDTNGHGVQGVAVTFTLVGTASLGTPLAITNAQGQASTTVTAGSTAGAIVVTATAGSFSQTFNLSSKPPGPTCQPDATFYNGVSFQPNYISPGGIATIVCTGLAPGIQGQVAASYGLPLPYQLASVTVTFGTSAGQRLAPIYNVSNWTSQGGNESVTVQVPLEVAPGPVPVTITVGGGNTTVAASISASAPGIFEWNMPADQKKRAILLRPDGSVVTTQNPAHRGDTIRAFVTGLIAPPSLATGMFTPLTGEIDVTTPVIVGVNNAGVPVGKVTYAANLTGVWVVEFVVPADTAVGNDAPFAIVVPLSGGAIAFSQGSAFPIQ